MKNLSPEEAIEILNDMKIDIPVPKAAVTQRKRNVALDMAISAMSCSETPNSSDCISRQAAIDAIEDHMKAYTSKMDGYNMARRHMKELIEVLPSAHPEPLTVTIDHELTKDECDRFKQAMRNAPIQLLPSEQPEIIRCKECKHSEHWYKDKRRCFLWHETGIGVFEDGYCNYAERETDE